MSAIRVEQLQISFGRNPPILEDLHLAVDPGERISIVGPSGAGKTTLLRLLAGFEKPNSGKIFFGGREVTSLPPDQRDVGFVFQSHALYPHLTVAENLAFPLRLRNVGKSEIAGRVAEMAEKLQLSGLLQRRPGELSGGESQRVALGRALIRNPAILLMDEPLSSLPPDLRLELRHELLRLHARDPRTLIYVTHDHEDALAIGQRVAVLHAGCVQQFATPQQVYEEPANRFVAGFIGKPRMNFIQRDGGTLGIRPEHLEFCAESEAQFAETVESVHYCGGFTDIITAGGIIVRHCGKAPAVGEKIHLRARPERIHHF